MVIPSVSRGIPTRYLKDCAAGSLGLARDDRHAWATALTHTALFPFEKSWIIEAKQLSS